MSSPIALGRTNLSPSPQHARREARGEGRPVEAARPGDALRAKTSPEKRIEAVDLTKAPPEVLEAAQGMESMFLDYMMQVMRKTVPEGNELSLESPATKIYRGMLDSKLSEMAAKNGGVGLAEQIVAYLDSQRYTVEKESMTTPSGAVPKARR